MYEKTGFGNNGWYARICQQWLICHKTKPDQTNFLKHIYLTHRWDRNRCHHSWSEWDMGLMAMKRYSTLPRYPELESNHQMQFYVIHKTLLFLLGEVLLLCRGYSQHNLGPVDRARNMLKVWALGTSDTCINCACGQFTGCVRIDEWVNGLNEETDFMFEIHKWIKEFSSVNVNFRKDCRFTDTCVHNIWKL